MIDPVATAQNVAAAKNENNASAGAAPSTAFQQVLAGAAPPEPVSAATAAEILRLKMLSSAVSIGEDHERPGGGSGSLNVQGILDRFLEQLPKGAVATSGVAGGDGAAAEAGGVAEAVAADAGPAGDLQGIIDKAARRYGVDGGLIKAVIKAESDFNPRAVSSVGAQGLMQLMPSTARGLGVTDPFDPEQNVMAGTRFLKDMLSRYGNVEEALAAYNWGPANVDRHGTDRLPRETRSYLAKVKGLYSRYVA